MLKRSIILLLLSAFETNAQTTVYAATPEGLPNKKKYYFFEYANFFVCDSCKEGFKDGESFEKFKAIYITKDHIMIRVGATNNGPQKTLHGYLTNEKKIFFGTYSSDGKEIFDPTEEQIKNAPYIYDKKIFDADGNIIAFIEGEEKYGAAWYLLNKSKI
jgi:hypothetical protein